MKKKQEDYLISVKSANETSENIVGEDKYGRVYYFDPTINHNYAPNKIVFGGVGSGRTDAVVKNDITQTIKRCESIVVASCNPTIYDETSGLAKDNGYEIKLLDTKFIDPKGSYNPLSCIKGNLKEIYADIIAEVLIDNCKIAIGNTYKEKAMYLLSALLLYYTDIDLTLNIPSFFRYIKEESMTTINDKFKAMPESSPGNVRYKTFIYPCGPSFKNSLLDIIKACLSEYNNAYFEKLLGKNDINMLTPLNRPCIYYICDSGTANTSRTMASLFINLMIRNQCEHVASMTAKDQEKQIPVNYIIENVEDFCHAGHFDTCLRIAPSHKITFTLLTHYMESFRSVFPKTYRQILDEALIHMFLGGSTTQETDAYMQELFKSDKLKEIHEKNKDALITIVKGGCPAVLKKHLAFSK